MQRIGQSAEDIELLVGWYPSSVCFTEANILNIFNDTSDELGNILSLTLTQTLAVL